MNDNLDRTYRIDPSDGTIEAAVDLVPTPVASSYYRGGAIEGGRLWIGVNHVTSTGLRAELVAYRLP